MTTTPESVSPAPDTDALRDEIRRTIGGDFQARLIAADLLDDDDVLSVLRVFEDVVPAVAEREAGLRADLDQARAERDAARIEVSHRSSVVAHLQFQNEVLQRRSAGARTIPDDAAERLAAIKSRAAKATAGPWQAEDAGLTWTLHGEDGFLQILKAPKSGTPYAEYWPTPADGEFIERSREDVAWLVELVEHLATPTTGPAPAAADGEVRALLVHPVAWNRLVDWLTSRGLTVDNAGDLEGIPTYSMGISDELAAAVPQAPAQPTGVCPHCHCAAPIHKTWCTEIDGAATPGCSCLACAPAGGMRVMNLCPTCGNKRCPGAANHRNTCTGSNEPGQPGSLYENTVSPADLIGPAAREYTAPPSPVVHDITLKTKNGYTSAHCSNCGLIAGDFDSQWVQDRVDSHRADNLIPARPSAPPVDGDTDA